MALLHVLVELGRRLEHALQERISPLGIAFRGLLPYLGVSTSWMLKL
jgi:hypothetical protein